MLVKLGQCWADPAKVVSIDTYSEVIGDNQVQACRVVTPETTLRCVGIPDDLAAIVNAAISTQSFGGGDDGPKET